MTEKNHVNESPFSHTFYGTTAGPIPDIEYRIENIPVGEEHIKFLAKLVRNSVIYDHFNMGLKSIIFSQSDNFLLTSANENSKENT